MVYRLRFYPVSDDLLELRLGWAWRIFFICVAGFIGGVGLTGSALSFPALTVGIVSVIAAVYREFWRFDKIRRQIESRIGLAFVFRTRRYDMDRLQHIVVRVRTGDTLTGPIRSTRLNDGMRPRILQRGHVSLVLVFREKPEDENELSPRSYRRILQTEPVRNREIIEALSARLSGFLGVSVREES